MSVAAGTGRSMKGKTFVPEVFADVTLRDGPRSSTSQPTITLFTGATPVSIIGRSVDTKPFWMQHCNGGRAWPEDRPAIDTALAE
jgi:hypothetical protein